jgi:hypothetical protein
MSYSCVFVSVLAAQPTAVTPKSLREKPDRSSTRAYMAPKKVNGDKKVKGEKKVVADKSKEGVAKVCCLLVGSR